MLRWRCRLHSIFFLIKLRNIYVDYWPITGIAFQSLLISYKVTTFNIIWKIKCTRIYFFYLLDQWFWTFQIWFNCSELGSPSPSSCINKRLLCKEGCDNYNWSWTLGWNLNWIQEKWWKIVQPSLPSRTSTPTQCRGVWLFGTILNNLRTHYIQQDGDFVATSR